MPFQSKSQQKFMHAVHPKMAKEWDAKTDFSKLPEKANLGGSLGLQDGSASDGALFKEDMPRALRVGKPFMAECQEDDTLMGRLAKRMAARDFIDKQNLGMGSKAQKAALADMEYMEKSMPRPVKIEGPVLLKHGGEPDSKFNSKELKEGMKIENEHSNDPRIEKAITKAHLVEDPKYNTHLREMEKKYQK